MRKKLLVGVAASLGALTLCCAGAHASWPVGPAADASLQVLAHRGVHQQFDRTGLTRDTCTAAQALPSGHTLIENTLPSMQAAFAAGATVVELDIHPTTDDQLAVFHDWTVDCRTDGTGPIRDFSMDALRALDVGHGYTTDGGATFPLRGTAVGQMPELSEVFEAFPQGRFLINVKSDDRREIDLLHALFTERPQWRAQVWGLYGSPDPVAYAASKWPDMRVFSKATLKACLLDYLKWGWSGRVPVACEHTAVTVPINVAPLLWGWPHRFTDRMRSVDTHVVLLGPVSLDDVGSTGVDTPLLAADVPDGFHGYVWTNRVEAIGPALLGAPE